jgi:hypothetical protein
MNNHGARYVPRIRKRTEIAPTWSIEKPPLLAGGEVISVQD